MTKPTTHKHQPAVITALSEALATLEAPAERSSRQVIEALSTDIRAALERGVMPDAITARLAENGITLRWPTIREYAGLTEARRPRPAKASAPTGAQPRPKPATMTPPPSQVTAAMHGPAPVPHPVPGGADAAD